MLNLSERDRYIKYGNDAKGNERRLMVRNLLGRNKPRNLGPRFIDNLKNLIKKVGVALLPR